MPVDVPTEHFFTPSRVPGQRLGLFHFSIAVFPFLAENNGLLCGKFFSTEFRWSARTVAFNSFNLHSEFALRSWVYMTVCGEAKVPYLFCLFEGHAWCILAQCSWVTPTEHRVLWKHIGPGVVPGPADCLVCTPSIEPSLWSPKCSKLRKEYQEKKTQNKKTQTQNKYKVFNFLILFVYNSDMLSGKGRNELILTHQLILWSDTDSLRLDSSQGPVSALYTGYEWSQFFLSWKPNLLVHSLITLTKLRSF